MNKPAGKSRPPQPLADLLRKTLSDAFAKQGFASAELVTRWPEIVGSEIAAHAQPEKIQWPRQVAHEPPEAGTLVLRVEGPTAVEIQHLSGVILERVNRFFGWHAVDALRLRQAPLSRRDKAARTTAPDPEATARLEGEMREIADDGLRNALARLGAAVKGS
jgi:hypothetical protein